MYHSVIDYMRSKTASKDTTSSVLSKVGIEIDGSSSPSCAKEVFSCISNQPYRLIRDCCIKTLGFDDLGPTAKYYPNHGFYRPSDELLVLNTRMLADPVFGHSCDGRPIKKFEFILAHELGHGWDAAQGANSVGKDYSLCPDWLELSDWSEAPKPGHKRLRIRERGYPEKVGEWYYGPDSEFCRYYGKMNPWDDWADCFAYYVTGMKDNIPKEKLEYFNSKIGSYYEGNIHPAPIDLSLEQYAPRYAFRGDDPEIENLLKKYPEFASALIRYFPIKEVLKGQKFYGIDIPDLVTYLQGTRGMKKEDIPFEKDTSILREYLGRVPLKNEEDLHEVINEFLKKHGPEEEMKIEPDKVKSPSSVLTFSGGNMVKLSSYLRYAAKKLSSDVKEVFKVNIGPEQLSVKSFEQFFEESSEEDLLEALTDYRSYIDSVYESYKDKVKDKKAFEEVFTKSIPNLIKMAMQAYKKPISGKVFKDPTKPTQEEIVNFVRVIIDRNLKNTLNRLKTRV